MKGKALLKFFTILALWSLLLAYAYETTPAIEKVPKSTSSAYKAVLKNGLTVIVKENRSSDIIALNLFIRVGSRYEDKKNAGISNFIQTMLLKGTEKRSGYEIAKEIESVGGVLDTDCQADFAEVVALVTSKYFKKGLELLTEVTMHPAFDPAELDKEKEVILSEIRSREERASYLAVSLLREVLYQNHPYAKPVLGYEQIIKSFNREIIKDFHQRHYLPNNMTLVVVGNMKAKRALREIGNIWERYKPGEIPPSPSYPQPKLDHPRIVEREKDLKQAFLMLGYPGPGVESDDYPALKVINSILGAGSSSRIYVELRDKQGLAYELGSFFPTHPNLSSFIIYLGTEVGNIERAKEGILKEITKLKEELVSEDELKRAKNYLIGSFALDHRTSKKQAWYLGWYELLGLGYEHDSKYIERIKRVTPEDIRWSASRYLNNYGFVVIRPKPKG